MVRGIDSLIYLSDFSLLSNKISTSRYTSHEVLCPKESLSRPQPKEILQAQQVDLSQVPFKSLFLLWVPKNGNLALVLARRKTCRILSPLWKRLEAMFSNFNSSGLRNCWQKIEHFCVIWVTEEKNLYNMTQYCHG